MKKCIICRREIPKKRIAGSSKTCSHNCSMIFRRVINSIRKTLENKMKREDKK